MKGPTSLVGLAAAGLLVVMLSGCQTADPDGVIRTNEPSKGDVTSFGDAFDGLKTVGDVEYYASDQAVAEAKNQFRAENYGNAGALFFKATQLAPNDGGAWMGLAASCDRIHRSCRPGLWPCLQAGRRDARILQQCRLFLSAARQVAGRTQKLPQGIRIGAQ